MHVAHIIRAERSRRIKMFTYFEHFATSHDKLDTCFEMRCAEKYFAARVPFSFFTFSMLGAKILGVPVDIIIILHNIIWPHPWHG